MSKANLTVNNQNLKACEVAPAVIWGPHDNREASVVGLEGVPRGAGSVKKDFLK